MDVINNEILIDVRRLCCIFRRDCHDIYLALNENYRHCHQKPIFNYILPKAHRHSFFDRWWLRMMNPRKQHRQKNSRQEDTIECSRSAADGRHGSTESSNLMKIEQVRSDERADGTRNIRERRFTVRRK